MFVSRVDWGVGFGEETLDVQCSLIALNHWSLLPTWAVTVV